VESTALFEIQDAIARICQRVSRDPTRIQLLAVTKRQPPEKVEECIRSWKPAWGALCLAENFVQALQERRAQFLAYPHIVWHLIGPLQSNKARAAVACADVIQTIHNKKIADIVNKEAFRVGKKQRIFLQVNISRDPAKSGVLPEELSELTSYVLKNCESLELEGLMTITTDYENPEDVRPDFVATRLLREKLLQEYGLSKLLLSMGMSADYEIAIEEGADIVRVGSALFGERI
jgi:pyridoxal phosphate enzyme (YggS family)